jgi:hypothetical protein
MNATATATKPALHACACGNFKAIDAAGRTVATTACNAETRRTFAPGHDARLKGFLIRAGREGHLIRTEGGADQLPAKVAERFGFAHMVREGIARPKATRKTKKVVAPRTVVGKVGRWTYEGTVTTGGGIFTYTDRQGRTLMAEKFTIVG